MSKHEEEDREVSRCSLAFEKLQLQLGQRAPDHRRFSPREASYREKRMPPSATFLQVSLGSVSLDSTICPGIHQSGYFLACKRPQSCVPTKSLRQVDADPPQGRPLAHPVRAVSPRPAKETGRQKPGKGGSKAATQQQMEKRKQRRK